MDVAETKRSFKIVAFGEALREVVEPLPAPKSSEVLLRVGACGVCHSDLHLSDGYFDLGGGKRVDLARGVPLPLTLGHEIAGEVVALGPEAVGIALGARRVAFPWIGCGACSLCAAGNEHLCAQPRGLGINVAGGYSDHVIVPHPRYLVDFSGLREELACTYACSGLTAYSALKKAAPVAARDPLLIIGAGGVGLNAVRLAWPVLGVAPIVADVTEAKRGAAMDAGASQTVDPADPQTRKELIKATGGGVAAAVDFVGSQASVEFGMAVLRKGGRLIVVGLFGGAINLATALLPLRAISLIGSYVGSLEELKALMALARAGNLGGIPVQSRPLATAQATLDDLRAGRVVGRAVLRP